MSEPTNQPAPDNTAAVAAELAKTMPEVTVQTPATPDAAAPAGEFPPDSLARKWDATRFRAGPDGTPRLDTRGRFIPAKLGRRKAGVSAGGSYIPPEPKAPQINAQAGAGSATGEKAEVKPAEAAPPPAPTNTAAAEVLTRGIYTATGAATGIPEEATPKPGDHENLKAVTAAALDATGLRIGVWLGLAISFLGYGLMVVNQPKTRKALGEKWEAWKAERAKQVSPPVPVKSVHAGAPLAIPTNPPPADSPAQVRSAFDLNG